jgi:hypothetical protein
MYILSLQLLYWCLQLLYIITCYANSSELGNQRHLCIMADLTGQEIANRKSAACAAQLCDELNSQAAPIIVTKTTWQTALKYAQEKNPQELKNWDIYNYKNFLLLFIPHAYKKKCNAHTAQDLGFNLAACTKISDPLILYTPGFLQTCIDYVHSAFTNDILLRNIILPYYSYRFLHALQTLILPKKICNYTWNILCTGHGLTAPLILSTICGLDTYHFKKFLQFLNITLNTRVLIYKTCFGGTKELLSDLYKTNKSPDIYTFPIICTCLTDAPAYYCKRTSNNSLFNDIHKVNLDPKTPHALIHAVHASTALYTQSAKNTKKISRYTFNNCPRIRWAQTSSFCVAPIDKLVTPLWQLTTLHTPTLSSCITVPTPGLVIDQPVVPHTLTLPLGKCHRIASSIPGPAHHSIHKCIIPKNFKPHMLLKLFSKTIKKLATHKLFLIDTIEYCTQDKPEYITHIVVFINATTPQTHRAQTVDELFYLKDNTGYSVRYRKNNYSIQALPAATTEKYLRIFNQEKIRLSKEQLHVAKHVQ